SMFCSRFSTPLTSPSPPSPLHLPYILLYLLFFFLMIPPPPISTLFPYTTLFRSVLYELVSGKHPFAQENDAETIAAILTRQPPTLPPGATGIHHGLDRVIRKCLEKDKERRYQSASELLLDLQNIAAHPAPRWRRPRLNPLVTVALLALLIPRP